MVGKILQQYGTAMTITAGETKVETRGFFQPVRSKSWQNMVSLDTPLGEVPRGQYIYIGPPEVEAGDGDILTVGEKDYVFRRVEPYYYGDKVIYRWGLCMEKGVNDTWGSRF
jgi:hypothetical protein